MENKTAVLLMAYGSPNSPAEIEPYYTDIRGGRKPSPENLRELVERYDQIGGRTPLLDITRQQAQELQKQLGSRYQVFVGMKHWHPYIIQAVEEIVSAGLHRAVALALAPHYSKFSIDGYIQRVQDAKQKLGAAVDFTFVESWNDQPLFLDSIADNIELARQRFPLPSWDNIQVVFSAHSLPERIVLSNDPYPKELRETCEGVATRIGLRHWRFAYQSAGRTGEKWLGPDLEDVLDEIAKEEQTPQRMATQVLIAPVGFVADHLEVLYDIDVECAERARRLGLEMRRIDSPNANPKFIEALAAIVHETTVK